MKFVIIAHAFDVIVLAFVGTIHTTTFNNETASGKTIHKELSDFEAHDQHHGITNQKNQCNDKPQGITNQRINPKGSPIKGLMQR